MVELQIKTGEVVLVDDADLPKIEGHNWRVNAKGYVEHGMRRGGRSAPYVHVYLHALILGCSGLLRPDHRNGNKLDNRKKNLRPATKAQNRANSRKQAKCSSVYKGVSFHRKTGKWQSNITTKETGNIYLGLFEFELDAAKAYNQAAVKLFGSFAKFNEV